MKIIKQMTMFLLTTCFAFAAQAAVNEYDFSTYTSGPLAGQDGWIASTHTITNGYLLLSTTNDWNAAWQTTGVPAPTNSEISISAEFSFSDTATYANSRQFMSLILNDEPVNGTQFRVTMFRNNDDHYGMRMWSDLGPIPYSYQVGPRSLMGLSATDLESDHIRLTMVLRKGATSNEWTYVTSIDNADTGANVANVSGTLTSGTDLFTAPTIYGNISNGQATAPTTQSNFRVYKAQIGSKALNTIVQWGEMVNRDAGDGTIVAVNQANRDQFGSYVIGSTHNPVVGANYYNNHTNRSPVFNTAMSASPSSSANIVENASIGDYHSYGANTDAYEVMCCWETFLLPNQNLTGIEMRTKQASATNGVTRFVIHNANGWFVSESFDMSFDYWSFHRGYYHTEDPSTLIWYAFTPITDGTGTVGAETAADMTGVDIVGVYSVVTDGTPAEWVGTTISYFKAFADEGAPLGWDAFVTDYGLSGSKTAQSDSDGLSDWGEYVFGGNPLDGNDIGTQPVFDATTGNYVYNLVGDNSVTAHMLSTSDLVSGSWATNATTSVTFSDYVLHAYTNVVGTGANQLFIRLKVE